MFVATLDTNVLVPGLLRDAILTLAGGGMLDPKWSPRIETELRRALTRVLMRRGHSELEATKYIEHLLAEMNKAFPDACVSGWEHLEGTFGVPDPDDEHVVALSQYVGAGVIVTDNLRDFRDEHLPGDLHALSGAVFLARTIEVNPSRAAAEFEVMAGRRGYALGDLLDFLVTQVGLPTAAADLMRPFVDADSEPAAERRFQ